MSERQAHVLSFALLPIEHVRVGLDSIELILRAEELFAIEISDEEAGTIRTVGDFYECICAKLQVVPLFSPVTPLALPKITEKEKLSWITERHKPLPAPPDVLPWSPQSIWDCLVAVFVDQLSLKASNVVYTARIAEDLGVC